MKIVNMLKLKEEFDYESLCRKLETQLDNLTAEIEREQKLRESEKYELEKQLNECQDSFAQTMKNLVTRSEVVVYLSCIPFPFSNLCITKTCISFISSNDLTLINV